MNKTDMVKLGLNEKMAAEANYYQGLYVGRIGSQYKDLYKVITENGELLAEISGKLRFEAKSMSDYPAVGDFVMLDRFDSSAGNAIIQHILTRKSVFVRKAAGTANEEQVIAANIDTVFICMSLNHDFNLRRLERYLSIAWDSGAMPVIVLTKVDLCDNPALKLAELDTVACGVEVVITSGVIEDGYKAVKKYLGAGRTVAFIGSSGVGKSTLINRLIGKNILTTQEIRQDDKGRHTTTRRDLFILNDSSAVIDTPGMRELGIENADLTKTFADIEELSASCRFDDCTHTLEPGCALREAINKGIIEEERLISYLKLQKEAKYSGLNSRQIEHEKFTMMFAEVGGMKNARKFMKSKRKKY